MGRTKKSETPLSIMYNTFKYDFSNKHYINFTYFLHHQKPNICCFAQMFGRAVALDCIGVPKKVSTERMFLI